MQGRRELCPRKSETLGVDVLGKAAPLRAHRGLWDDDSGQVRCCEQNTLARGTHFSALSRA
eukprot:3672174-Pleurochrysis_carterae.AAC.1